MSIFGPNWGTVLIDWIKQSYILSTQSLGYHTKNNDLERIVDIIAKLSGHDVQNLKNFSYGMVKPKFPLVRDIFDRNESYYTDSPETIRPSEIIESLIQFGPGLLYPLAHLVTLNGIGYEHHTRCADRIRNATFLSLHHIGVNSFYSLLPIINKPGMDTQFVLLLYKNKFLSNYEHNWPERASIRCVSNVCDALQYLLAGPNPRDSDYDLATVWRGSTFINTMPDAIWYTKLSVDANTYKVLREIKKSVLHLKTRISMNPTEQDILSKIESIVRTIDSIFEIPPGS